jgi:tetratricopeptide (TPR) repeat protein
MIGKTVLHYKIEAQLGSGGMGRVYLARDERTERKVALKFVGSAEDESSREQLQREAQAVARLSHPGVVALYSLEEADGEFFLVQEYVEGETLASRFKRGAFTVPETLRLARELSDALVHSHKQGVLHRDLKPENILVAPDGSYKVADFGIARLEGMAAVTEASDLIGTLPYMAPERAKGDPGDGRSDLFALGAILYEALFGKRAFAGATQSEVLYKVINDDPPMPETMPTNAIPLAELIHQLLSKEPKSRPGSADVVAGILQGIETTSTDHIPTIRTGTIPAFRKSGNKSWVYAAIGAAAVVVIAIITWVALKPSGVAANDSAVAVLYFENLTDPEDSQKMGAITGNLLITSLAHTGDINVLSTQNILDALRQIDQDGGPVDRQRALEVAKKVHAGRIVTGSILQTQPNIIMTAEVSDVKSGRVLGAEQIEGRPGETVFQVVDALGARLMARLAPVADKSERPSVAEASSGDLEAHRQYIHGLEELAGGDLDAARKSFAAAVARDPDFAQAYYQLAIVQWWQSEGRNTTAGATLEEARKHADRLTPLEQELVEGIDQLVQMKYAEARGRFDSLARFHPRDKLVAYGQMEATYHTADFAASIEPSKRALEIDPDYTLVASHLISALRETNRAQEAIDTARDLLRRTPKNGMIWRELANAQSAIGDGDGIIRTCDEAIEAGIPKRDMGMTPATLHIAAEREAAAREWATLEGEPEWRQRRWRENLHHDIALHRGEFNKAYEISKQAWSREPTPEEIEEGNFGIPAATGINAAVFNGQRAQAYTWLDSIVARVLRGQPLAEGMLYGNIAGFYYRAGDTAGLRQCIERSEAAPNIVGSENPHYLRMARALLYSAEGNHDKALAEIDGSKWEGLANFTSPGTRGGRMMIYRSAGRYAEALAQVDTLLLAPTLSPDDAVRLYYWRGEALENLGRLDEAAGSYRKFLSIWENADPEQPEMVEARKALERIERSTS